LRNKPEMVWIDLGREKKKRKGRGKKPNTLRLCALHPLPSFFVREKFGRGPKEKRKEKKKDARIVRLGASLFLHYLARKRGKWRREGRGGKRKKRTVWITASPA